MSFLCKISFHKWRSVKETGKFSYRECIKCGRRKIFVCYSEGHQPVDWNFLNDEEADKFLNRYNRTKAGTFIRPADYSIDKRPPKQPLIRRTKESYTPPKPIKEGSVRNYGLNKPPTTPRPNIRPKGEKTGGNNE